MTGERRTFRDGYRVRSLALSRDGRTLLTGSGDTPAGRGTVGRAQLWDALSGKRLGPPLKERGAGWAVALSPDDGPSAGAGGETRLRLYRVATRRHSEL